ncbi:putative inorganic phosphate cotransporter [Drosophila takahashii]|uniref:putative inorganic phosphate cotransporter n=1 Tax=Drosophila takahashii TaxID=29030 RepID=UPI001CF822B2|nr:putative inorganic phosphate cotransporter [Drosophila takahashii]
MADTPQQPAWGLKMSKFFVLPQRWILAIMGFFAIFNAYTMRVCLSQAITVLVVRQNYTAKAKGESICEPDEDSAGPVAREGGSYEWSEEKQGLILASFYIGYIVTHLPGGILADKFGGKWTLSLGILATAIFTLITPVCIVYGGADALIVLRVLMGLGEGTTFPALSVLLAAWVPANERGMLGALVLGGGQVGSIAGNLLSGLILDSMDWPWVFYVFAIIAIAWFIIFTLLCFSSPYSHPFIKPREREFLAQEIPPRDKNKPKTPFKAIFTNVPMYALISAQIGHDWGFYIMVSYLPKYMADVLRFSIKSNGLYSSLPYVTMWVMSLASGCVADQMIKRNCMNTTNTRKLMTGLAAFGPAVFMVGASYAGCNRALVVALFTICMGLMGTYYAGMKLTPLDMSPNYAGTLMAITNGIGAITGVISPYLVGVMTPNATLLEWRIVFWVAFAVLVVTAIVYCIWASGDIQPFNDGTNSNKKKEAT